MPFKSKAQRRWMHANKPEMAQEWEGKTSKGAKLPERASKKSAAIESVGGAAGLLLRLLSATGD